MSVLSGNRNFEGRIHPLVRANYLASPPLVVAYALAGRMDFDMASEPLGNDKDGKPVFLRDIWPSPQEVEATVRASGHDRDVPEGVRRSFRGRRALARPAGARGRSLRLGRRSPRTSRMPPFFDNMPKTPGAAHRHQRRARAGDAGQQRHHRPHLARRLDRRRQPGRKIPDRATA